MLLRSSPSGLELNHAGPGEAVGTPNVLDPRRMNRIGRALMPYFVAEAFNRTAAQPIYPIDINFIRDGVGKVPLPLRHLIAELDESFPVPVGRVSILRIRHHLWMPHAKHTHPDTTFDYRFIAPFSGESDLAARETLTSPDSQLISLVPGDIASLNNGVPEDEKLLHGSRLITPEQYILVYGREIEVN